MIILRRSFRKDKKNEEEEISKSKSSIKLCPKSNLMLITTHHCWCKAKLFQEVKFNGFRRVRHNYTIWARKQSYNEKNDMCVDLYYSVTP